MVEIDYAQDGYFRPVDCNLDEFIEKISHTTSAATLPHVATVEKNIPIYDVAALAPLLLQGPSRREIMAEWAHVLRNSAGVFALKNAYPDTTAIDEATSIYSDIIAAEKAKSGGADHFSAAGNNDRIWNSLQKLCEASPGVFAKYFANTAISTACEAWLGPNYQMTAQINLVRPGGAAQQAHRDYHLGFQTAEISAEYPAHVHDLSPALTLQGAIAHSDMPLESGPTKLLPFSQLYPAGYAAWRLDEFREYFEAHHVQLPLLKGDALFFNPALFHAAGANVSTDIHRMANLVQVSSAFGRAMETVDRESISRLLYPALVQLNLPIEQAHAAIASGAEGYSFPTNLDTDPPVTGLAPETQQALMRRALQNGWDAERFNKALQEQTMRKRA